MMEKPKERQNYEKLKNTAKSKLARHLLRMIEQASTSESSVLIWGETGTGKEVVANAIHELSNKVNKMTTVNISATPKDLVASELFGHVEGAFSGADNDRVGVIRKANGGTLFLDEIGELSELNQIMLLRVLEEGKVCPVGGDKPENVAVRFLAATNRNLRAMVSKGQFREDLYYRLSTLEIRVPPLRERWEDIPEISDKLIADISKSCQLDDTAKDKLQRHVWPGNVRELRSVLDRAINRSPSAKESTLKLTGDDLVIESQLTIPNQWASAALFTKILEGRLHVLVSMNPNWGGLYFLPGGKMQGDQKSPSFRAVLVRSLSEELDLREGEHYEIDEDPLIVKPFVQSSQREAGRNKYYSFRLFLVRARDVSKLERHILPRLPFIWVPFDEQMKTDQKDLENVSPTVSLLYENLDENARERLKVAAKRTSGEWPRADLDLIDDWIMNKKRFFDACEDRRKIDKMTQKKVCELVGVSENTYRNQVDTSENEVLLLLYRDTSRGKRFLVVQKESRQTLPRTRLCSTSIELWENLSQDIGAPDPSWILNNSTFQFRLFCKFNNVRRVSARKLDDTVTTDDLPMRHEAPPEEAGTRQIESENAANDVIAMFVDQDKMLSLLPENLRRRIQGKLEPPTT